MSGLRFPGATYDELASALLDAGGLESCGIAYARHDSATSTWIVSDAVSAPTSAYETRTPVAAVLTTRFVASVAARSRVTGMAAVLMHTHPGETGIPRFSATDDAGERALSPYFARRGASTSHLAVVIGPNGCRARLLGAGPEVDVWQIGRRMALLSPLAAGTSEGRDDRQVRAFGEPGQRLLRRLRIVVIGAGGTGSLVCQQLAHLGVLNVAVIDRDLVEATNLNRLVGATPADVGRPKVQVAARMMRVINPAMTVEEVMGDVVDDGVASTLAGYDLIMICTDSHASRAVANQIAYQHLVPAIDMGVGIGVADGRVAHVTGRVQMLSPGLPCLTCGRAIDADQVRREMQTPEERAADPYVEGEHEPQPAVISINSTVSSLAVTMLLGAVTPIPAGPRHQRYDGLRGRVTEMAVAAHPRCVVCSPAGALARGASWPLPTRRST